MASNPCLEFFEANKANMKKVKALVDTGNGDSWAGLSASLHSPGVVEADEELVRQLVNPVHWDDELDQPKPSFFDDVLNKGMSVNRLRHTTEEKVEEVARIRAAAYTIANPDKQARSFLGLLRFQAAEVIEVMRSVAGGSGAVFDTALEDAESHADVCQTRGDKEVGRNIRSALFEHYKQRLQQLGPANER